MPVQSELGTLNPARILIVDDHPAVREGLAHRIAAQPDLTVCGTAADEAEALAKTEATLPHLVIVDISLKESDGLDLVKAIRAQFKQVRCLVHSMYDETMYADRCLQAGAMGYLNKEANPSEVVTAVREILGGGVYLSPDMTRRIVGRTAQGQGADADPMESLTDRQLEIFRLLGEGYSVRELADRLVISMHTVETHRENIKRKLNLSSSAELSRRAALWVADQA